MNDNINLISGLRTEILKKLENARFDRDAVFAEIAMSADSANIEKQKDLDKLRFKYHRIQGQIEAYTNILNLM